MSHSSHLIELQNRHSNVEKQIREEYQRPIPDHCRLHDLKRKKLQIKDEISRILSKAA